MPFGRLIKKQKTPPSGLRAGLFRTEIPYFHFAW
jgi:hypothetical protein